MAMNGTTLETAVISSISAAVISEADWATQVKQDVKNQLQIQIGDPMWTDGNMDAGLDILTTALGLAIVPHLEAIVAAVSAQTIAHITANATVTTATTGTATIPLCTAGGIAGTTAGSGTGTVA